MPSVPCEKCGHPHPADGIGDGEIEAVLRERDAALARVAELEEREWDLSEKADSRLKRIAELEHDLSETHKVLAGAIQRGGELLGERDRWRKTAILNGKRLESIRALTTTRHESLGQFVSRVRACLYQDHF